MESLNHYIDRLDKAQAEFDAKFKEEEDQFDAEFNEAVEPLIQLVEKYYFERKVFAEVYNLGEFRKYICDKVEEVI